MKIARIARDIALSLFALLSTACLDLPIQGEAALTMGAIHTALTLESPTALVLSEDGGDVARVDLERGTQVLLADYWVDCNAYEALASPGPDLHTLAFTLLPSDGGPIIIGRYTVQPDDTSIGQVTATFLEGQDGEVIERVAADGAVYVDAVDGTQLQGEVHLRFGEEGALRGVFMSAGCEDE